MANQILKEHILKGYTTNDKRLEQLNVAMKIMKHSGEVKKVIIPNPISNMIDDNTVLKDVMSSSDEIGNVNHFLKSLMNHLVNVVSYYPESFEE